MIWPFLSNITIGVTFDLDFPAESIRNRENTINTKIIKIIITMIMHRNIVYICTVFT